MGMRGTDYEDAPILIVKDTYIALERRNMIQRYVDLQTLADPIVIHTEPAVEPFLTTLSEQHHPNGFQNWR